MDDPYRVLELQPGASATEVKQAYRRLAKAYHPDSAGEEALPRFLAIHEAYERLRTGRATGGARTSRASSSSPSAGGDAGGAEPWRADPARARAARERARAGRAGAQSRSSAAGGSTASGGASASSRASASGAGSAAGRSDGGGARASTGTSGGSGARPRSGRRSTRKATLGSTSYDEARDPNDPTWSGASWYGPSTGEYWIINPREYADPRKHGPAYQQRARQAAAAMGAEVPVSDEPLPPGATTQAASGTSGGGEPVYATAGQAWTYDGRTARERENAARGATIDGEPDPSPRREQARGRGWRPAREATPQPLSAAGNPGEAAPRAGLLDSLGTSPREWIGGPADDPIRRLGIALVAWPPIGLAAAALIGDITGCSVYSAECGGSDPLLPWLAQAGILGLLLLLPPIARLLAGGSIAIFLALIPISMFLLAVGGGGAPQAGFALSFLLAIAWIAGIAWSAMELRRRGRAGVAVGPAQPPRARPGARP